MELDDLEIFFSYFVSAKLRAVVSLLRLITSSVHIVVDDYTVSHLVNKLLKFIRTFTPYAQTGSQFNKNCLLTIGNLMIKIEQLKIESKYMKLLSGLCSHRDYEVRAYAWSILTKLSTTLNGAEQMINGTKKLRRTKWTSPETDFILFFRRRNGQFAGRFSCMLFEHVARWQRTGHRPWKCCVCILYADLVSQGQWSLASTSVADVFGRRRVNAHGKSLGHVASTAQVVQVHRWIAGTFLRWRNGHRPWWQRPFDLMRFVAIVLCHHVQSTHSQVNRMRWRGHFNAAQDYYVSTLIRSH